MRILALATVAAALLAESAHAAPAEDDLDELYAEAHPPQHHAPAPLTAPGRWYGWQTLLADASFIAVFASTPAWGDVGEGGGIALVFDLLGFLATAPVIHSVHGNADAGGMTMLLRLGATSVGALTGFGAGAAARCSSEPATLFSSFCGISNAGRGAYYGTLIGAGLAAVLDAVAFAWEKPDASRAATSSFRWTVSPFGLRGGAGLGVVASF